MLGPRLPPPAGRPPPPRPPPPRGAKAVASPTTASSARRPARSMIRLIGGSPGKLVESRESWLGSLAGVLHGRVWHRLVVDHPVERFPHEGVVVHVFDPQLGRAGTAVRPGARS